MLFLAEPPVWELTECLYEEKGRQLGCLLKTRVKVHVRGVSTVSNLFLFVFTTKENDLVL